MYREQIKVTSYLYIEYVKLFDNFEEQGYQKDGLGDHVSRDQDCFLSEQRYISNTNRITQIVYDLREILMSVWSGAVEFEKQRLTGIQNLYEEIVKVNQTIYGVDVLKKLVTLRDQFTHNDLYQFRGLAREKELESFIALCYQQGFNIKEDQNITME